MKGTFKRAGYDAEEVYFYKLNQSLIEELQAKREKARANLKLVVDNSEQDNQDSNQTQKDSIEKSGKKAA